MIPVRKQLEKAGKTTVDYLNWLEDDRRSHGLEHLSGDLIVINPNSGSAKKIKIHPDLMDNFNEFLNT